MAAAAAGGEAPEARGWGGVCVYWGGRAAPGQLGWDRGGLHVCTLGAWFASLLVSCGL